MRRAVKRKPAPLLFKPDPAPPPVRPRAGPPTPWLPEPQERWVQPPMPGRREPDPDTGEIKLWFE